MSIKLVPLGDSGSSLVSPGTEITGLRCTVGRRKDNDLVVLDGRVSKLHAEILLEGTRWVLNDLGSANGSLVNGEVVRNKVLEHGDVLQFGRSRYLFEHEVTGLTPVSEGLFSLGNSQTRILTDEPFDFVRSRAKEATSEPRLQDNYDRLHIAFEALSTLLHSVDRDALCARVLEVAFEMVNVESAAVALFDADGRLEVRAQRSTLPREDEEELELSRTVLQQVLSTRTAVLATDSQHDERFAASASIVSTGTRSLMCVPLLGQDEVHGVLYGVNTSEFLNLGSRDLTLFHGIGVGAGVALDKARLIQESMERDRLAAVGTAVNSVAHHLKNIVQSLRLPVQVIRNGIDSKDNEVLLEALPLVERAASRMEQTVVEMLDYSKSRTPMLNSVNLNELVKEVLQDCRADADAKGVELRLQIDSDIGPSMLDDLRLHDAIVNLIRNGIDAHDQQKPGRYVAVRTVLESDQRHYLIEVRDNGSGIPAHLVDKLFVPFFSTKGNRGTGLGLAGARKVAEENGGSLSVMSYHGQGSVFRLLVAMHPLKPRS